MSENKNDDNKNNVTAEKKKSGGRVKRTKTPCPMCGEISTVRWLTKNEKEITYMWNGKTAAEMNKTLRCKSCGCYW